jgi:hypothetical protein
MTGMNLKPDAALVVDELRHRGLKHLYHYTLLGNVPSILRHRSLFSRNQMRARGIEPVKLHGWGRKGKAAELGDYLCLALNLPTGMLSRESADEIIIFQISIAAAGWQFTLFSPKNSAVEGMELTDLTGRDNVESLSDLFLDDDSPRLKNPMAEVLVRDVVPLSAINNIVVLPGFPFARRLALYKEMIINRTWLPVKLTGK